MPTEPRNDNCDTGNGSHCVYKSVARLLTEEPQLEAVAFEAKNRKLSIATIGRDSGARIGDRVREAVAERVTQCGLLDDKGLCTECGESPTQKVGDANVVVKTVHGNTVIEKLTCRTAIGLWQWRQLRWPRLGCCEPGSMTEPPRGEWQWLALLSLICLALGTVGFFAQGFALPTLSIVCFAISYVAGGWDAAVESWRRLRRGELDIHFLMLAVALGAAAIGAWSEGALLLFLFSASGAMEHYASGRTRGEIAALLKGSPKTATVLDGESEHERPVEALAPGMRVRVRAGQQIPADLRVVKGDSACDESNLTGESIPMPKEAGDVALAGTLNLWGNIDGDVLRPAKESALQKIIALIERAQQFKAPSQKFTDRFGTSYTYAVLIACAVFFLFGWIFLRWPPFISRSGYLSAFYRAMTLLVVASPCALVLSVPSAILSAIAAGARRGVLFRGGSAIETLAEVKTVALDKTGTLTRGEPVLVNVQAYGGDEAALLQIAYGLARLSNHPLSRAVQKLGASRNIEPIDFTNVRSTTGKGIEGRWRGRLYVLGSRQLLREAFPHFNGEAPSDDPTTAEVWVGGADIFGCLAFRDELRPQSRSTLRRLRKFGLRTVMLTGDRNGTAEVMGERAGVDEVRAQLSPEDKLRAVQQLKEGGRKVAMIGDGVNDAPCLAAADVGVAMGARGSDAALEQAEVVLMNDRLENFVTAYRLSRRARKIIRQNVVIALGTVATMALLAITRGIPLGVGVFAHEGSTVIVVLNSLRLLALSKEPVSTE
jgi:Cd2+/Zn2+-exporting ATPase